MLPTAPVGPCQEMGGKSPDATCGSVPAFPGDILHLAVGSKHGDDTFDVTGIHAPHITRQRVVDRLTIFQAYCCVRHCLPPLLLCWPTAIDLIEACASHRSHDRPCVIRTSGEPVSPGAMSRPLGSR